MTEKIPAIFAALNDEIKNIKSKFIIDEKVYLKPSLIMKGQYNKKPCLLVRTGIGKRAMSNALDYCLKNYDISVCINIGYVGGTIPDLSPGDIVIGTPVIDSEDGKTFLPENELIEKAEIICKQNEIKVLRGGVVTVDKVISTPHEKAFVGTEHNAVAVDMESSSFMKICKSRSVSCVVVRSVLDSLDIFVPNMGDVIDEDGKISVGAFTSHIVSKPKDILSFPKIEYCASKARDSITSFIGGWL